LTRASTTNGKRRVATSISLFKDLAAAAEDAGDRLSRQAQPSLFDRLDWFRLVHEHTPDGSPLVIRVRNGASSCWLFLQTRGRYAESLANWYSLRFAPVVDGPAAKAPVAEFVKGLRQAGISHVFLEPLEEGDRLAAEFRRKGWATVRGQINVSWRIDTRGMSFDDYWASRTSRLRNTVARKEKKAKLDIRIHDRFDVEAWDDYCSVFAASWKPAEGSPELLERLARQESEAGTLRLGLAYRDGQAVAAQLWLVENGVATIHKLAYREDARDYSPGSILSREMFRRALDVDRAEMIDFGVGNDPYKQEWMTYCVPLYGMTAYDLLQPAGIFGVAKSVLSKIVARLRPAPEQRPARYGGRQAAMATRDAAAPAA
jgi:CelD/BcsL family acetyltransferase involved in cellulose biosynthesis